MKLQWKRNYEIENTQDRKNPNSFEWYTAQWWICFFHVHNNTPSGRWEYRMNGGEARKPVSGFDTKEDAMTWIEDCIEARCREFLSRKS